jgi:hypothetical protein
MSDFCNGKTSARRKAITDGLYIIQTNLMFHGVNIVYKEGAEKVGLRRTLQMLVTLIKILKPS